MRAKDALEDHLHELVCQGRVDLGTTQRDPVTDWISAYQKYFHTSMTVNPLSPPFSYQFSDRRYRTASPRVSPDRVPGGFHFIPSRVGA